MITIKCLNEPDLNWNKRLLQSPTGTIYQTKEMAKYFEKTLGYEHSYLQFLDQTGKIVGQLLLSKQKTLSKNYVKNLLRKISSKTSLYRWIYGPTIFDTNSGSEIIKELYTFFKKINFPISGSEHPLMSKFFSNTISKFKLQSWSTFLIDLSLSENILLEKMNKRSAQKNIERSLKKNILVKEIKKSKLHDYYKMLAETKEKVGHKSLYENVLFHWKSLHPIGFTGFMAYNDETPIGGIMVSNFNNYINEWGIARTKFDMENRTYAQDLLKWNIIQWGKRTNAHYYDLTGVNPYPVTSKESGILRYKQKWGGNWVKYNLIKI